MQIQPKLAKTMSLTSIPELPSPLSFIAILAILVIYVAICYLVLDLVSQDQNTSVEDSKTDHSAYSHLSVEALHEITCVYHGERANTTCAICLDSFRHDELCRIFPACHHLYHAVCIDPWLSRRLTCPICRTPFRVKPSRHA